MLMSNNMMLSFLVIFILYQSLKHSTITLEQLSGSPNSEVFLTVLLTCISLTKGTFKSEVLIFF